MIKIKTRIIHCADIHFDAPFKELHPMLAEQRREDLRETFKRICSLSMDNGNKADIILIAGDLFDNARTTAATINQITASFSSIPDTLIFIAPGNHDHLGKGSILRATEFPDNVYVFGVNLFDSSVLGGRGIARNHCGRIEAVDVPDLSVCIYGSAFEDPYEEAALFNDDFRVKDNNRINIMVLHADLEAANSPYNPLRLSAVADSGLDYIALGHVHRHNGIKKVGGTSIAYSGVPEGHGFDETGECGIIAGGVGKDSNNLSFLPVCKRKYEYIETDVSGLNTHDDIFERILAAVGGSEPSGLYKVALIGLMEQDFVINTDLLEAKSKGVIPYLKVLDNTSLKPAMRSTGGFKSLGDLVITEMLGKIKTADNDNTRRRYELALKQILAAFEKGGA